METAMVHWGKVAVVTALVVTLGAHWALLQSIAWVGMIVTYAQEATFAEAVEMTFDGQHPCKLCKVIQAGRAAEKHPDAQSSLSGGKFEPALLPCLQPFVFHSDFPAISIGEARCSARHDTPPKPPPRRHPPGDLA